MKTEIWAVSVLLKKDQLIGDVTIRNILGWRSGCTENEAKGLIVQKALDEAPGFAIIQIISNGVSIDALTSPEPIQ